MVFGVLTSVCGLFISLLIIAFFILRGRKILCFSKERNSPNKDGVIGLLQSFADVLKLVVKISFLGFQSRGIIAMVVVFLLVGLVLMYCAVYSVF